ncbi:hypothetical protein ASG22_17610 [Chryseobacterium sp. Leaf405]|uniref:hypothetical protein n=1 Tax=Chryseobacterium sp. Leaf405 TaxID=1736367 RepID=UPI0006FDA203|nr:hypothetical protein [Chryseobacterium sp. Leaf405]KQT33915.1 hypothetical protein ASG22_17610 [Chryseobacterium sp. Leaf405]
MGGDIQTKQKKIKILTTTHELGHSILKAYNGILYSFSHNDSSKISQVPNGKYSYNTEKNSKEINLMRYFKNNPS